MLKLQYSFQLKKNIVNKAKQLKSTIEHEILEQKDSEEIKVEPKNGCDLKNSQPALCRISNTNPYAHIPHNLMTAESQEVEPSQNRGATTKSEVLEDLSST